MFLNVLIRLADPCSIIEGTVRLYRFASLTIKKVFHLTKNNTISDVFNTLQTKLWTMLTLLINPITWPIFYGGTSYHEKLYLIKIWIRSSKRSLVILKISKSLIEVSCKHSSHHFLYKPICTKSAYLIPELKQFNLFLVLKFLFQVTLIMYSLFWINVTDEVLTSTIVK